MIILYNDQEASLEPLGRQAAETTKTTPRRPIWEAKSAIGVVDFELGRLNCDRGRRFYSGPAQVP